MSERIGKCLSVSENPNLKPFDKLSPRSFWTLSKDPYRAKSDGKICWEDVVVWAKTRDYPDHFVSDPKLALATADLLELDSLSEGARRECQEIVDTITCEGDRVYKGVSGIAGRVLRYTDVQEQILAAKSEYLQRWHVLVEGLGKKFRAGYVPQERVQEMTAALERAKENEWVQIYDRIGAALAVAAYAVHGSAGLGWTLYVDKSEGQPALVFEIVEKGPAAKAGIKPQDVIVSIDGQSTQAMAGGNLLQKSLGECDSPVAVSWKRGTQTYSATLKREAYQLPSNQFKRTTDTIVSVYDRPQTEAPPAF